MLTPPESVCNTISRGAELVLRFTAVKSASRSAPSHPIFRPIYSVVSILLELNHVNLSKKQWESNSKLTGLRAWDGDGVLGEGQRAPSPPARRLGSVVRSPVESGAKLEIT